VVEEGWDIARWELEQKYPQGLLNEKTLHQANALFKKMTAN